MKSKININNLLDKSFGKIKIINEVEPVISKNGNKRRRVLGQCECGVLKTFNLTDLTFGHSKSCGCISKNNLSIRRKKEIEEKGLATAKYRLYQLYKRLAKKRDYEFLLTSEQFENITTQSCIYCGIAPKSIFYNRNKTETCIYNGVDRINNKEGYTINNSVPCCTDCNWAKKEKSFSEFKAWIKRVYLHLIPEEAVKSFEGTLNK